MNNNHDTNDLGCLLQRYFSAYLINQRRVSSHTVAAYRDTFRLLLPFLAKLLRTPIAALSLVDLNHESIIAFLHYLEQERHVGARTRNCPSRKLVHLEILDLFYERHQRGIYGHRHLHRESKSMETLIGVLLAFLSTVLRSRFALQLEIVELRHQLTVYQRTTKRPRISFGVAVGLGIDQTQCW